MIVCKHCHSRKATRCDTYSCSLADPLRPYDILTMCRPCWIRLGGNPNDKLRPSPCRHLGGVTDRRVSCPSCKGNVELKLFTCNVYGNCTIGRKIQGTACCIDCPSYASSYDIPDANKCLWVNMGAGGIGDALLGMLVVGGLKKTYPDKKIVYCVSRTAIPWVELFDCGYDYLVLHAGDGSKNLSDHYGPQLNNDYDKGLTDRTKSRLERYKVNARTSHIKMPQPRDRQWLIRLGAGFKGFIVLVPYSTDDYRNWPLEGWLSLELLLVESGYATVVLDSIESRCNRFTGHKVICATAEVVAGIIANSACLIGSDSGLAHLAGCLGTPAVVLCGQPPGHNVYGAYSSVRCIQGSSTPDGGRSGLASITPTEVLSAVSKTLPSKQLHEYNTTFLIDPYLYPSDPWIIQDGIDLIRRTYLEKHAIALLLRATHILEIGVRYGYSAASFLAAPAAGRRHYLGIDKDDGSHGGVPAASKWAESMLKRNFPGVHIDVWQSDTRHLSTLPEPPTGGNWDLIHVDGDHTEAGCYCDLELAWNARPRWILVDDITHLPERVGRAVDRFLALHTPHYVKLNTVRGDVLIQGQDENSYTAEDASAL